MNGNTALQHHQQRLHRAARAVEPSWIKKLDRFMYVIAALGIVMTIPQLTEIWIHHNASGVSAISWGSYCIFAFFWLAYAIAHRARVLIITQCLWVILNAFIAIGAIIY